ncbi:MAG: DUF3592 domain-containing protein [Armatimonadota bacterium]
MDTASLPRRIPLPLASQVLFAGGATAFGWLFFGFGLFLAIPLLMRSEAAASLKFLGPLSTAQGTITQVRETGGIVLDQKVYAVDYTFTPPGGGPVKGTSYVRGGYRKTGAVTVEYRPDRPQTSRIRGLHATDAGWAALFVLIFPGVGLIIILVKFIPGLRALRLMRHGLPAVGTLVAVRELKYSRSEYGGDLVCRMTFRFTPDGRPHEAYYDATDELKPAWLIFYNQANGVTYNPARLRKISGFLSTVRKFVPTGMMQGIDDSLAVAQATEPPAEHELQETVLYLPNNPAVAALPRSFDTGITLDDCGNLHGSVLRGILAAILPVLVILGECAWIYLLINKR